MRCARVPTPRLKAEHAGEGIRDAFTLLPVMRTARDSRRDARQLGSSLNEARRSRAALLSFLIFNHPYSLICITVVNYGTTPTTRGGRQKVETVAHATGRHAGPGETEFAPPVACRVLSSFDVTHASSAFRDSCGTGRAGQPPRDAPRASCHSHTHDGPGGGDRHAFVAGADATPKPPRVAFSSNSWSVSSSPSVPPPSSVQLQPSGTIGQRSSQSSSTRDGGADERNVQRRAAEAALDRARARSGRY